MVTRPRQLAGAVLLLAATTGAVGLVAATDAAAASCNAVTISAGRNLTLNVSNVFVTEGGCVRFANLTDVTVSIRVSGSSFSERLPARTPATASRSFTATKSAGVTATDGVRTGHGTITVSSAASPAATPTPTSTRSTVVAPLKSTKPTPSSKPPKSSASHGSDLPSAVSTDAAAAVNTQHTFALPALPSAPPVQSGSGSESGPSPPPTVSHPVVAPRVKSSDPRLTSTVLEPAGGPRRGLPATVATVLLVGLAAAYGRTVLVAGSAVDRPPAPRAVRRTV